MKFAPLILSFIFLSVFAIGQDGGMTYEGETVNVKDTAGLRQGPWVILGHMQSDTLFTGDMLVERGEFVDNRKHGIWLKYFPSGKLHAEVTYQRGRARGWYKEYWENGQVMEEGTWDRNKNKGEFKRWHENGQLMHDWNFNSSGKREGVQTYYAENGQKIIEGTWNAQGKKEGKLTRWTESGELKAEEWYTPEGKMDVAKTVFHEVEETVVAFSVDKSLLKENETATDTTDLVVQIDNQEPEKATVTTAAKKKKATFLADGFNELKRKDGRPAQRGEFRSGRMWDGKVWVYSNDGLLQRILIYRNGKPVGTEPIDDDDV